MVKPATSPTAKATATTLPKEVFSLTVENHELLHRAYNAYLANGRENLAQTKTRGLVRGGGKKPWRQKGTGRARVGSSRTPVWRGGGITFGPTGNENYSKTLPLYQKRQALRQALSLSNHEKKITIVDTFKTEGKTKDAVTLLEKHSTNRRVLLVVEEKSLAIARATRNVPELKTVQATYLSVFDILNADHILITKPSVELIQQWLAPSKPSKVSRGASNA